MKRKQCFLRFQAEFRLIKRKVTSNSTMSNSRVSNCTRHLPWSQVNSFKFIIAIPKINKLRGWVNKIEKLPFDLYLRVFRMIWNFFYFYSSSGISVLIGMKLFNSKITCQYFSIILKIPHKKLPPKCLLYVYLHIFTQPLVFEDILV